jgi:flavin reductase (DIM6/NTAB) family NADH-FMN oxidoreductase RutF
VAGRSSIENGIVHHKLDGIPCGLSDLGSPVLDGAISWLECSAEEFVPLGDHTLVAGRVVGGEVRQRGEALTSSYAGFTYSG